MEDSSNYYYNQLAKSDNPGVVLATFYCEQYNKKFTRSEVIMFNRLLRMFNRFLVFFATVDAIGSNPNGMENPYPYIFRICKTRFESSYQDSSIHARESLDKYLQKLDGEIEEFRKIKNKLKIPSSEGLK